MAKDQSAPAYDESSIQRLNPREHIRLRPGMYVGGTDIRAMHHLVYEIVDNAVDEALAGRCDQILVTLHDDYRVSVSDNGVGIPVGVHRETGQSTLEMVLTEVGTGGKFNNSAYKVSGGLHGVGAAAVNALSEELTATVYRDGHVWQQTYRAGEPQTKVAKVRPLQNGEGTGTIITFRPDFTVLETNEFNYTTLMQRFREMSFVTRKVTITLRDEREKPLPRETTFYFEGGLRSFVRYLNRNRETFHQVVHMERDVQITPEGKAPYSIGIEVAFQYNDSANVTELAFANTINTPDGGTHLTGLRSAVTGVINRYARKAGFLKEKDSNFSGTDTLEGLTAIVSVKHPHPAFESQTKVKLINPEVQGAVSQVVTEAFNEFLELNPREARKIVEKCMTSMRAREAARKARDLVRSGPSLLESSTLPGKLADCSSHGENAEIYIVEGDSAGGCFSGDTKVALADGRALSFVELVEEQAQGKQNFCYTIRHDGTIGLERILHARMTKRNAAVVRVTLDNGEVIVCTPEHPFMLRDGSYKAAAELTSDDALLGQHTSYMSATVENIGERTDVYDIEVPGTHNFALASGVFVHNSAKQGRDRHFQAILPLRGKILNTERARLDKMLDNNEIKALISALGTGVSEDFDVSNIRYGRVIIMSVAGDEPTLVKHVPTGTVSYVQIGTFIDECMAGKRSAGDYEVMSFDNTTYKAHFRPLKAVIRHEHAEPMYKLKTRYGRSIKVTSSHSVFIYEQGEVRLKKGNEIKPGDVLVGSRRLPRPSQAVEQIDLLHTFVAAGVTDSLFVKGEAVRNIAVQRTLGRVKRPDLWNEPKVVVQEHQWQQLIAQRQAVGASQKAVAQVIGVAQPITINHWERGVNRPILSQFRGYLNAIGWEGCVEYELVPSKVESFANVADSGNKHYRVLRNYLPLSEVDGSELVLLDDAIEIVPRAHHHKGFGRYLPVSHELLWFLGWYVAEGTMSKHQISLNLGKKDERFIPELTAAVEHVFGETPRCYHDPDSDGIKFYFQSVLAARLLRAWRLDGRAHEKTLPDLVFNVSEALQRTFLEGYFLGDGTTAGLNASVTTNSRALKDRLLYLFGQLGIVTTTSHYKPSTLPDAAIQTRQDYYTISICGKQQLANCRDIWGRHQNAPKLDAHIGNGIRQRQEFVPISEDLIGMEVLSAEEIAPVGEYVYDFSVEEDENFICGVGGLCAHNTDADVDGSHIRTLLLTFFFRHMQPLISEGHLYIAQPPIFRLQHGKDVRYVYPQAGQHESQLLATALKDYNDPDKVKVSRYKGLGEMNPDQLWETTMDPATRTLLQVTIEDAVEADHVFDMLMGAEVPPRRKFIVTHAKSVRNLDI
jgi:DNA gyrase subunit B